MLSLENVFWKEKLMESRDIRISWTTTGLLQWWYILANETRGSASQAQGPLHQSLTSPRIKYKLSDKTVTLWKNNNCVRNAEANATMFSRQISSSKELLPLGNKQHTERKWAAPSSVQAAEWKHVYKARVRKPHEPRSTHALCKGRVLRF